MTGLLGDRLGCLNVAPGQTFRWIEWGVCDLLQRNLDSLGADAAN
jgi:hypothetical protein